jgi:DNA-binding NtrC family response regulator
MADTVLHEIMHMRQYRRRKFKDLPDYASTAARAEKRQEQEYLGNSDEIDAYSFNIACELLDKFHGNTKKAVNYLNEHQKGLRRRHNCWRMYLKAFDYEHNHPIIQRVKKKVIRYMPHALNGKPYRNKDWIDR